MTKVGVYNPEEIPESFRVCITNICNHLRAFNCEPVLSSDLLVLKTCDVLWDPRAGGGHAPHVPLTEINLPLIVTLHGIGPMLYPSLYSVGLGHRYRIFKANSTKKKLWKKLYHKCYKIVTVSQFSKSVIAENIKIPLDHIDVIYNGFDGTIFNNTLPFDKTINNGAPYYFHISNDEPRKNVDQIIEAYQKIKSKDKWRLILKLSSEREVNVSGIKVLRDRLSDHEVANYYRSAGALLFPSIYEGFGLPIAEALACDCTVITTKNTACEEVGKDAVELVKVKDLNELVKAMKLVADRHYTKSEYQKKRNVIDQYSWIKAAKDYSILFHQAKNNL